MADATDLKLKDGGGGGKDDKDTKDGSDDTGGDKTFTQADLDKKIKERLARERKRWEGVDRDEYLALKKAAEEKAEAEKTELEKLAAERDAAQAEAEKTRAQAEADRRDAAVIAALTKARARDPERALRLLDLSGVTRDDDGKFVGIDDAITAGQTEAPWAFGAGQTPNLGAGDTTTDDGPTYTRAQIADTEFFLKNEKDIMRALAEGRIKD